MMDKDGKGWPSWAQMDDVGKGIVVMVALLLFVTLGQWVM